MMYCSTAENRERLKRIFVKNGTKITSLTAYTTEDAALLKKVRGGLDFVLVGDSVSMVRHGYGTTQAADMEMMQTHGRKVVLGYSYREKDTNNPPCESDIISDPFLLTPVVVDMPECEYRGKDPDYVVKAAKELASFTGCSALKIEAGADEEEMVAAVVRAGIPVMGHIGMMPSKYADGEMPKIEGKTQESAAKVMEDALAIEKTGAFAIVIEGVFEPVAKEITAKLSIPTIGIGASPDCDGQILVLDDMLGWNEGRLARFVKIFMDKDLSALERRKEEHVLRAVSSYNEAVRNGTFPSRDDHCYGEKFIEQQKKRKAMKEAQQTPVYGG